MPYPLSDNGEIRKDIFCKAYPSPVVRGVQQKERTETNDKTYKIPT